MKKRKKRSSLSSQLITLMKMMVGRRARSRRSCLPSIAGPALIATTATLRIPCRNICAIARSRTSLSTHPWSCHTPAEAIARKRSTSTALTALVTSTATRAAVLRAISMFLSPASAPRRARECLAQLLREASTRARNHAGVC